MNDQDIQKLLEEKKVITLDNYHKLFALSKIKGKHKEQEVLLNGTDKHEFIIKIRQSIINPIDFSVIVGFIPKERNKIFRLKRYNGKSHKHKNSLEKDEFYDFHIHTATQRYNDLGYDEEAYAQVSDKYSDLKSAIETMIKECNIIIPNGAQLSLT